jgi:S1/P1 nuclease
MKYGAHYVGNHMSSQLIPVLLSASLFLSSNAYSWGHDGHHTVGAVADILLRGTNAEKEVQRILGGSLAMYAVWADCAKGPDYCPKDAYHNGKPWYDDEMKAFNEKYTNPKANLTHHDFHFTDIPIEEHQYFEKSVGAKPNDLVRILRECIDVLRHNDNAQTNPHQFTERDALLLIAHLVGDIHQPLHVGAVYVGSNLQFVNPNTSKSQYHETQGGNYLFITRTDNLHHYWDDTVVTAAMTASLKGQPLTPANYAKVLLKAKPVPAQTAGDIGNWPTLWANETLAAATSAYSNLKLGPPFKGTDAHANIFTAWPITSKPANYAVVSATVASRQLTKGGYRLAELLKRIWP